MENKKEFMQDVMDEMQSNEEFLKAFVSSPDAATLQKVLSDNGFSVSLEDVNALFADGMEEIRKVKEPAEGAELSLDQLDDVAGGGFWRGTARLAVSCGVAFGYGCFCGICPAAYAGAPYVATGLSVWSASGYLR